MSRTRSTTGKTPTRTRVRNSFEQRVHKALKKDKPRGAVIKYESERLPYIVFKDYIPDFIVYLSSGHKIYVEAKGYLRPSDRTKMIAVKKAHPDLDIRFFFAVDNKLYKNAKSRYSDWCIKHGFPYAVGTIPKDWLSE